MELDPTSFSGVYTSAARVISAMATPVAGCKGWNGTRRWRRRREFSDALRPRRADHAGEMDDPVSEWA